MIERNGGGEGNCLLAEATQELRPKGGEGARHGESWGRGIQDRGQSRCKGPEVGHAWCVGGMPRRLVWLEQSERRRRWGGCEEPGG